MLSTTVSNMLKSQLNKEYNSAYLYRDLAARACLMDLPGVANWLKVQYHEETYHATKFSNYLLKSGELPEIVSDYEFPSAQKGILEIFKLVLSHEEFVTQEIAKLVNQAKKEGDSETYDFLKWFINEQKEELSNVNGVLDSLKSTSESDIEAVDKKMGERRVTVPTDITKM